MPQRTGRMLLLSLSAVAWLGAPLAWANTESIHTDTMEVVDRINDLTPDPTSLIAPGPELPDSAGSPESEGGEPTEAVTDEDEIRASVEAEIEEAIIAQHTSPTTEIPPAEELLQLGPIMGSPAARFSDLLNPPAEVAQNESEEGSSGSSAVFYNVPVSLDPAVQKHIRFFDTAIRGRFEQWLARFGRYQPLVERIFSEFNLPTDLIYLSLVESGFNPYAYSRARATGPWQFMKGTAQLYGLRVDSYVDERRDPIKSTVAAARYLRDLYDLFGTWPLAMAAYNAGEGKVMRALRKARAESFSDIAKTRLIRRETREYVPRFMAATIIAKNPDRYGFPVEEVTPHEFEEVVVTRPVHFKAIANVTGIPYKELRLLNPELRRDATPPNDAEYHLKIPVGTKEKFEQLQEKIPTYKFRPNRGKSPRVKTVDGTQWYRVRVGDSLAKIAKRFRTSVKSLKAQNNLSSALIRPGDFLIIAR